MVGRLGEKIQNIYTEPIISTVAIPRDWEGKNSQRQCQRASTNIINAPVVVWISFTQSHRVIIQSADTMDAMRWRERTVSKNNANNSSPSTRPTAGRSSLWGPNPNPNLRLHRIDGVSIQHLRAAAASGAPPAPCPLPCASITSVPA